MGVDQLKVSIAKKLRAIREQRNLSQEDVARQLGVTTGAYGSFERAKNLISVNHLISLSRIFQVPITDFLPAHVVTDSERNSPMLDPLFAELADAWPALSQAAKEALLMYVRAFLQDRRQK